MKSAFVSLYVVLITLVSLPAWAESKVGVINIERVMRDSEPAKRAMKKLEKEFEKRGQDLEKMPAS